jgi:hypothetical protein
MNKTEYAKYQTAVAHFLKANNVKDSFFGPSEETNESHFSWQCCECCRRPIAGNRETYSFAVNQGESFTADICQDCVYYLTYDRLDDAEMALIEKSIA